MLDSEWTPGQIADELRVNPQTVRRIAEELNLSTKRTTGNHRRFSQKQKQAIIKFFKQRRLHQARSLLQSIGEEL